MRLCLRAWGSRGGENWRGLVVVYVWLFSKWHCVCVLAMHLIWRWVEKRESGSDLVGVSPKMGLGGETGMVGSILLL